jgi:hypothetical protein
VKIECGRTVADLSDERSSTPEGQTPTYEGETSGVSYECPHGRLAEHVVPNAENNYPAA